MAPTRSSRPVALTGTTDSRSVELERLPDWLPSLPPHHRLGQPLAWGLR